MRIVLHEYTTWKFIESVSPPFGGGRTDPARFRQRRNRRHPRSFALLGQTLEETSRERRPLRPRTKISVGASPKTRRCQTEGTQNHHPRRGRCVGLSRRPLDLADHRRPHSKKMGRRVFQFQYSLHSPLASVVVSKTRSQVDEAFASRRRTLAALRLAPAQKKADDNGYILILWDESGFSFVPNCVRTWAPVGETPVLFETSGRHNHTGIGYMTRTPCRHLLKFRFTMFKGSAGFEDFVYFLSQIHHYYGDKVVLVWDNLPAHDSAESYFEDEHPNWYDFYFFPTHSPELNPVEPCWHHVKHVYLPNFVPASDEELVSIVDQAMESTKKNYCRPFSNMRDSPCSPNFTGQ